MAVRTLTHDVDIGDLGHVGEHVGAVGQAGMQPSASAPSSWLPRPGQNRDSGTVGRDDEPIRHLGRREIGGNRTQGDWRRAWVLGFGIRSSMPCRAAQLSDYALW